MKNNYPTITISSEGETWLQKGQMWMYRNNLVQADENIPDGGIVNIIALPPIRGGRARADAAGA